MSYRPEFDGDPAIHALSPRVWFRIALSISLTAALLLAMINLGLYLVVDARYSSGESTPTFIVRLADALKIGSWMLILNVVASAVAYVGTALFRRRRP